MSLLAASLIQIALDLWIALAAAALLWRLDRGLPLRWRRYVVMLALGRVAWLAFERATGGPWLPVGPLPPTGTQAWSVALSLGVGEGGLPLPHWSLALDTAQAHSTLGGWAARGLGSWGCGAAVSGALAMAGWRLIRLARASARELASVRRWRAAGRLAPAALWPRPDLPVIVSRGAGGPALVGFWRPAVLVGEAPWAALTSAQRAAALAHEAAHLDRRDHRWRPALLLIRGALCWCPGAGWLLDQWLLSVEADCDHRAVREGVAPAILARAMLILGEREAALSPSFRSATGRRIASLLSAESRWSVRRLGVALLALTVWMGAV